METTHIDAAIEAAFTAATALGARVAKIAPQAIPTLDSGAASETVQTDVYISAKGSGFRIVGTITFPNGFSVSRVKQSGWDVKSERPWPANLDAEVAAWPTACLISAEKHVELQGYTATRLVTLLNAYLVKLATSGNNPATLAASNPKLASVYAWTQTVQATAAAGGRMFPQAPFPFSSVIEEIHA